MGKKIRPTRDSTCSSLRLPEKLCCRKCLSTIQNYNLTGNLPKEIKGCYKPFDPKHENARSAGKRAEYRTIMEHIDYKNTKMKLDTLFDYESDSSSESEPRSRGRRRSSRKKKKQQRKRREEACEEEAHEEEARDDVSDIPPLIAPDY
jgi:hypothetical protein